ncbi:MAG TPA: YeeE/YedE thiosulfate transporter family protein, partial [Sphingomonadaceae bacterium]|nr:YeeE/YedE thiosulfate transporter family protein [Sphingomonadaceae bacterium]
APKTAYPAGLIAVAGGMLLGWGALINGACVFGSVARIGSRDWHFLLTPLGFYLGSLAHARLLLPTSVAQPASNSSFGGWLLLGLFLPFLAIRLYQLGHGSRRGEFAARLWHPHQATIMIGVTFVILVLAAGAWTYPESLYRAAHRAIAPYPSDLVLFFALLGGAVIGGWNKEGGAPFSFRQALACLAGGALMGVGSSMIPGGNDNLSLVGIPMGHSYAWVAIGAMALAIWTGLIVGRIWRNFASLPLIGIRPSG